MYRRLLTADNEKEPNNEFLFQHDLLNCHRMYTKVSFFYQQLAKDLLHPSPAEEKKKCKLKRLVQHPNSYFMDVKCPGEYRSVDSALF